MTNIFVHIDIETTGPTPMTADLLTIGGVAFREDTGEWVGGDFYSRIRYNRPLRWNAGTREWWLQQNDAAKIEALEPQASIPQVSSFRAAESLDQWLGALEVHGTPTFVAYPVGFDWMWIACLLDQEIGRNRLGHFPLCLASAGYGTRLPNPWGKGVGRAMRKAVPHTAVEHHALDDARHQADMHRWLISQHDTEFAACVESVPSVTAGG